MNVQKNSTIAQYTGGGTSFSLTLNVPDNPNTIVAICIQPVEGSWDYCINVKIDGNNMTLAASSSNRGNQYIYYYINPGSGDHTITGDSHYYPAKVTAVSFYNVDLDNPIGNTSSSNYYSELSLTPAKTGSMILGASDGENTATGGNQTIITSLGQGSVSYTPTNTTAGSSVTFSYSNNKSYHQSVMVEIPALLP